MPPGLPTAREPDAPVSRQREASAGVFFVDRTAGWLAAVLLLSLLVGVAYVGTSFFTREMQFDRLREDVHHLNEGLDELEEQQLQLERRLVQLETEAENRRER